MIAVFLLGYDDDFSTFQERFESFLLELEKQRKTKLEEVSLCAWQHSVHAVTIQLSDTPRYRTAAQHNSYCS